jgi:rRNA small subunit pseudouridine methyltransferase Nep1
LTTRFLRLSRRLLQVFIHTANNVLIEVNPQTRIPRTFPRFAGLMVQLLHKFSIRAADSSVKLLKVIKNPVNDHLPTGCRKVLMSYSASEVVRPAQLVPEADEPICLVVGAIAKGSVETDYTQESVRIGSYP